MLNLVLNILQTNLCTHVHFFNWAIIHLFIKNPQFPPLLLINLNSFAFLFKSFSLNDLVCRLKVLIATKHQYHPHQVPTLLTSFFWVFSFLSFCPSWTFYDLPHLNHHFFFFCGKGNPTHQRLLHHWQQSLTFHHLLHHRVLIKTLSLNLCLSRFIFLVCSFTSLTF